MRKVVLSGGPCAGKTTIAEVIAESFSDKVVVVPEAASLLFRGGFPRWEERNAHCSLQRAVYRVQCEMEGLFLGHHSAKIFVFDRGTIDGAAYWPDGPEAFYKEVGSSEAKELARYDHVIYLESASLEDYSVHQKNHPARTENWELARKLSDKTKQIWAKHPKVSFVKCRPTFVDKVSDVVKLIQSELDQLPR